ncbi:RecQ family ATP-dependent DNA helicase [Cruoricaptor ignavus]|uniref:ATP-dependent DNA helicase RecQ n=1 Tax=Cruoricaptor ignavus TaxID=1118202 RepID=A0A7M1T4E1_9FLAO|nr:RecQ family ATP-dependent DNA helicase [Cruoricaptor ignavus]
MCSIFYFYKKLLSLPAKSHILKTFWGYEHFREPQDKIIDAVISGKDTLAILPTGSGKSLCYQVPALMLSGCCIVISPLLALMKDQVIQLQGLGIEAQLLSAETDSLKQDLIYSSCKNGQTKLLYISPERLGDKKFLANAAEIPISFLAVDEAHCISEWGQDFRPAYLRIKNFREVYANVPIIALTATATKKVSHDIVSQLGLRSPIIYNQNPERNNLNIYHKKSADKYQEILNFLKYTSKSGIIYVRTRGEAENLFNFLKTNKIPEINFYHAGLPYRERTERQTEWQNSETAVIVATNAFGMGIDKENVGFVIHHTPPQSIENYYQEIGRAGRGKQDADTILFWNEEDLKQRDEIFAGQIAERDQFVKILKSLYSTYQIAEHELPDATFEFNYNKIQTQTGEKRAIIKNILAFLHRQEVIFFDESSSKSCIQLSFDPQQLHLLAPKDAWFAEQLLRSLPGIQSGDAYFNEDFLVQKLNTEKKILKSRLRELELKNLLKYTDGNNATIKFLSPREDRFFEGKYWKNYKETQRNKLQKWEEMKYFILENHFCKMQMILKYFGGKSQKKCGRCSVCLRNSYKIFSSSVKDDLLRFLKQKPASAEEIFAALSRHQRQDILENLILLLNSEQIFMVDHRTYALT